MPTRGDRMRAGTWPHRGPIYARTGIAWRNRRAFRSGAVHRPRSRVAIFFVLTCMSKEVSHTSFFFCHGTRFGTMAILVKALKCATKRLPPSHDSPRNLLSQHSASTSGPTRPPRPRCRIRSALRLRPSVEAPHWRATRTLRRGFVPVGAIAVGDCGSRAEP